MMRKQGCCESHQPGLLASVVVAGLLLFLGASPACAQKLNWQTPIGLTFSIDSEGNISVTAGIAFATPIGVFSIDQEFPLTQGYSYVVFRDRRRGRDKVYKVPGGGEVKLKTTGKNSILVRPNREKVVIEVTKNSCGTVEASVVPGQEGELMRIDLVGATKPYLLLKAKGSLVLTGWWYGTKEAALDSVASIELIRTSATAQTRHLTVNWKPDLGREPLKVSDITIEPDALGRLETGLKALAPHVRVVKDVFQVNLGWFQPEVLVLSDHRMIVKRTSSQEEIPLDSISSITIESRRWEGGKNLVFKQRDGAADVRIESLPNSQDLTALTNAVKAQVPGLAVHETSKWFVVGQILCVVVSGSCVIVITLIAALLSILISRRRQSLATAPGPAPQAKPQPAPWVAAPARPAARPASANACPTCRREGAGPVGRRYCVVCENTF